jgi:hypothetical protein
MADEQLNDDPVDTETQTAIDKFLEHVEGVTNNVANARWEEVEFHLAGMAAIAETEFPGTKPLIDLLMEPVTEYALGFRQFVTSETREDKEQALQHLSRAKDALRKARTENQEFFDNSGLGEMARGIEMQIVSVQEQIARGKGDAKEAARLAAQRERLLDETIDALPSGDEKRPFLQAFQRFQKGLPDFTKGVQCLVEMNLDLAQGYLEAASKAFSDMHELFDKTKTDELIFQAGRNAAEGFGMLVSGQEAYVRVLRTAIIGDVNRSDVQALEKAERASLDGGARIAKAVEVMPGAFGGLDIGLSTATQAKLIGNLRALCERSLSPKQITANTAPRVVFYFVGTFVVLLVGLPVSGLVVNLKTSDLGLLLIVAVLVSVIGAFGFEVTRLVPLFEVFSRMVPWGGSKEGAAKTPESKPAGG